MVFGIQEVQLLGISVIRLDIQRNWRSSGHTVAFLRELTCLMNCMDCNIMFIDIRYQLRETMNLLLCAKPDTCDVAVKLVPQLEDQ